MQQYDEHDDPSHSPVGAWFAEMKATDERTAPDFDRSWQAATVRQQHTVRRTARWRMMAASILLLLGLGGMIVAERMTNNAAANRAALTRPISSDPALSLASNSIMDWESPTEFLLDLPVDETAIP